MSELMLCRVKDTVDATYGIAQMVTDSGQVKWVDFGDGPEDVRWRTLLPLPPQIVASVSVEAWVRDVAVEIAQQKMDVTLEVLCLSHEHLVTMADNRETSDDLVVETLDHDGPRSVSVVESIEAFFGVNNLEEITQNMLESARRGLVDSLVFASREGCPGEARLAKALSAFYRQVGDLPVPPGEALGGMASTAGYVQLNNGRQVAIDEAGFGSVECKISLDGLMRRSRTDAMHWLSHQAFGGHQAKAVSYEVIGGQHKEVRLRVRGYLKGAVTDVTATGEARA